jgi:hypothetical protein
VAVAYDNSATGNSGSVNVASLSFSITVAGVGSVPIVVTPSTNCELHAGAISFTGAASVTNGAGNNANSANSTALSIASAVGDMVFIGGGHGSTTTGVGGTGTQRWVVNDNAATGGGNAVGGTYAGAASVSASCTSGTIDLWATIGGNVTADSDTVIVVFFSAALSSGNLTAATFSATANGSAMTSVKGSKQLSGTNDAVSDSFYFVIAGGGAAVAYQAAQIIGQDPAVQRASHW